MRVLVFSLGFLSFSFFLSAGLVTVDPDNFAAGIDISTAFPYVTLSSGGGATGLDGKVYAADSSQASTGSKVFANHRTSPTLWFNQNTSGGYFLRADFALPTNYVSIDIISDGGSDYPSISVYDTTGHLESVYSFTPLNAGEVYHAIIQHTTADIAYIKAGGLAVFGSAVLLDNLKFQIPEPATCLLLYFGFLLLKPSKKKKTHSAG
ncbi:MAG: hypothetical protein FJ263_00815 [Planctomycetes bacterium]|nr:hypothetical protein [Planctomycetota bacterium]